MNEPRKFDLVIQDVIAAVVEAKSGMVAGSAADVAQINITWSPSSKISFPRMWDLFSYLLPRQTRERVFEPARQELLEDYLTSSSYRTPWARRWLTLCFTFRTALMVADCIRVMLISPVGLFLLWLVPTVVRRWWWLLWWK
jgi:hypothetical protein